MQSTIATLTRLIDNEVIRAMGLPTHGWRAEGLHGILKYATSRFSRLFTEVDRIVGEQGLPSGALWLLRNLAAGLEFRGADNIPPDGPLVIASNHPGAVDSVALAASVHRPDLKIIASAVPFLQNLPNIRQHLIFTPRVNLQARMVTVRESIRHLEQGGALLVFAHGTIDPDPAFMPQALEELSGWSRSLEIFLRCVPEAQVIVSIVSSVLDPACMRHPLTHLRSARRDRQRLAMILQVIQQMLGRKLDITPRVSFGEVIGMERIGSTKQTLDVISVSAQQLMQTHMAWQ